MLALSQIGFGLDDIRRLTVMDAIALTDLAFPDAAGESEGSGAPVREATQADIDRFLS